MDNSSTSVPTKIKTKHADVQIRIHRASTGKWEDVTKWKLFKWAIEYRIKKLLKFFGLIKRIKLDGIDINE